MHKLIGRGGLICSRSLRVIPVQVTCFNQIRFNKKITWSLVMPIRESLTDLPPLTTSNHSNTALYLESSSILKNFHTLHVHIPQVLPLVHVLGWLRHHWPLRPALQGGQDLCTPLRWQTHRNSTRIIVFSFNFKT